MKKGLLVNILSVAAIVSPIFSINAATKSGEEALLFGYCGDYSSSLGTSDPSVKLEQGAIEIPADLAQEWKGARLTKVHIGFGYSSVKEVDVYLTDKLGADPFYSQPATMTTEGGWNEVKLDCPYEITGDAFFVGYSTAVNGTSDRPIGIDNIRTDNPYGSYINTYNEWEKVGKFYGCVCIRLSLEGDNLPQHEITVNELKTGSLVTSGEAFTAELSVTNNGVKTVRDLTVTCSVNGVKVENPVAVIPEGELPSGSSTFVQLSGIVLPVNGKDLSMEVTVIKVNGEDDEAPLDNSITTLINSASKVYKRNVVVEEFTGTWCGWCPIGIVGMAYMKEKYEKDGFIGIAVHIGDVMTVDSYAEFANKVTGSTAPAAYLDRTLYFLEPSSETLEQYYLEAAAYPTCGSIGLEAVYSKEKGTLTATSTSEFSFDDQNADYAVAFVVLENNVGPYYQQNYFSGGDSGELPGWSNNALRVETYYNEVPRDIETAYGIDGSVPASVIAQTPYTYTKELPLTNVEDINECEVVALLLDKASGAIINAAKAKISEDAGIEGIEMMHEDGIIKVFNPQGLKVLETKDASSLKQLPKGIYIVNGKKVMI